MAEYHNKIQPVILIILDGWGIAPPSQGNAVTLAETPVLNKLTTLYPTMTLQASGEAVGLIWGEPGNSEVGHLSLGSGKIIWQNLPRINQTLMEGSFYNNPAFLKAMEHVKKNNSTLHLMGLVSNGAVHSSNDHLYALLEIAAKQEIKNVAIHVFLDGRDTPQDSGQGFINELMTRIKDLKIGKIATLSGRFYAMDRDNHWERIEQSYLAMTKGLAEKEFNDPLRAIESSYQEKIYDEELKPVVIVDEENQPVGKIEDNDAVIFFNFRSDRARELTRVFTADDFTGFRREKIKNLFFVTMTEYEKGLPVEIAFPPEKVDNPLGKIISDQGLKQMHIAETEKYAHVTFFFNGGVEKPFLNENRILIPSPRVASYDQKPEMSASEVCHQVLWGIGSGQYHFIVVNFANPDMLGHTGNIQAAIKALETLDELVGQIIDLALKENWVCVITADHGNVEEMINLRSGEINKEHTANPVPFIVVDKRLENKNLLIQSLDLNNLTSAGILADVAPTILKIMGLPKPKEMSGTSLV
ncbi:MAG: 2,3-bisphosphoglycerate-independent phosphoglycerate mutase [Patescibacteria group bacterium]|nr:2,3-bisphosphoglycerate-independent phosphoglycerate mutase [Patescibacteria group bacterium]